VNISSNFGHWLRVSVVMYNIFGSPLSTLLPLPCILMQRQLLLLPSIDY
jgi:hypothetical protein